MQILYACEKDRKPLVSAIKSAVRNFKSKTCCNAVPTRMFYITY